MNKVELLARRKLVLEFIKADPVRIELTRNGAPTKTAAGGRVPTPSITLPPQRARIIMNKRRYDNGVVNSEAGDIPHTDYLLLGVHTLNVEVEDSFTWMGEHYKVTGIHEARIESKLCSIDLLGEKNR